jgi:hypothetical protein
MVAFSADGTDDRDTRLNLSGDHAAVKVEEFAVIHNRVQICFQARRVLIQEFRQSV